MDKEKQHGGGLSSGFLLGVIVGVIITLLLTTKRGKKLLKMITEEGMQKFSNLEDVFNDIEQEYSTQPVEKEVLPVTFLEDEQEAQEQETASEEDEPEPKPLIAKKHPLQKKEAKVGTAKRFFKGVHRRSVNLL